jgi:hypothetical protein
MLKENALRNRRKATRLPPLRYLLPLACAAAFAAAYTLAAAQHAVAAELIHVVPNVTEPPSDTGASVVGAGVGT